MNYGRKLATVVAVILVLSYYVLSSQKYKDTVILELDYDAYSRDAGSVSGGISCSSS